MRDKDSPPRAGGRSAGRRRTIATAGALTTLLLTAVVPATASATAVTSQELTTLADRAQTDPAALEQLRQVDSVDGRAYSLEDALAAASADDLDDRLQQIAQLAAEPAQRIDPAAARREAERILSDNRYEGSDLPRPFKGVLDSIGEALDPIRDWIENAIDDVANATPGGNITVWAITAALLLVLLATVGQRSLRARAEVGAEARALATQPERDTPQSLERAADRAEREGDLETALRLRFRAGLLRLDARHAIAFRPSISTREVSRALKSPEFDRLAALFDGVVYGGQEASAEDLAASREGWDAVLRESAPR